MSGPPLGGDASTAGCDGVHAAWSGRASKGPFTSADEFAGSSPVTTACPEASLDRSRPSFRRTLLREHWALHGPDHEHRWQGQRQTDQPRLRHFLPGHGLPAIRRAGTSVSDRFTFTTAVVPILSPRSLTPPSKRHRRRSSSARCGGGSDQHAAELPERFACPRSAHASSQDTDPVPPPCGRSGQRP